MRIGIDISQIVHGTGVSFYTRNLVKALAKIDRKNQYILFGGSLRQKNTLQDFADEIQKINKNFSCKIITLPPTLAEPLFNRFHHLPIEKFIGPVDVFHSSDWIEPPAKSAKVTTIHDFGFMKYPDVAHPKITKTMKRKHELIKKETDLIITVSQSTKKDTTELLGIPAQKIRVIYEASPEEFKKTTQKEINKVKSIYKIKGDYVISVATLEPRKNLKRIIEAFSLLKEKGLKCNLVIVGKFGWGEIKPSTIGRRASSIIFTGYVPNNELQALYSGASCLVYPSLYEGFGLPILEAFTCKCPVVTSNVSSMPEIAGKAAVLVNPRNVDDISRGINEAIKNRNNLIKEGLKQLEKFSWEKTARETLKVYEEAYQIHQKK